MALQKDITVKGLVVSGGYIKVVGFRGNKERLTFTVAFKATREEEVFAHVKDGAGNLVLSSVTKDAGALHYKDYTIAYDINGDNPIAQAYEYLKGLEEFSSSTNV